MWGLLPPHFFAPSDKLSVTGQAFLVGFPFLLFSAEIIKYAEFDASLRPHSEHFGSTEHRVHGGFPSGHMAWAAYTATLAGLRHGPRAGIPLTMLSGVVFIDFLTCNRHYLSQLVAGAGLGIIYGMAAYQLAEGKIAKDFAVSVEPHNYDGVAIKLSYGF